MAQPSMEYDLGEGAHHLDADTLRQIKILYDLNMYRARSEEWAFKDIQFLIYDNTDDDYDNNEEENMLQYGLKLSPQAECMNQKQSDHEQNLSSDVKVGAKRPGAEADPDPERPSKSGKGKQPACNPEADEEEPCKVCFDLPEFPQDRKPRKLRLFKPRDRLSPAELSNLTACMHYVPMSYCWASRSKDEKGNLLEVQGSYQIRERDRLTRQNRAPDEVLDRAIDFAQTCGLRMIWIDQECLPQKDHQDREIGLQAMDIVYNRAIVTAGLHSTIITDCNQIKGIDQLVNMFESVKRGILTWDAFENWPLSGMIPLALDFIDKVRQEKWYTRAWIAQEYISASGKIYLVFPLAPGLTLGVMEQKHRFRSEYRAPSHSLDNASRRMPAAQWSILEKDFRLLVDGIAEFYRVRDKAAGSSSLLALKPHAVSVMEKAAALWPVVQENKPMTAFVIDRASYGFRRRLNAAGALTIFQTRKCRRPHDRLAIMANMCGYDVRLNTNDVETHGGSLRVALLALATLNSDLSLFVPELYRPLGRPGGISPPQGPKTWTNLIQPFDTSVHLINYDGAERGNRIRPRSTMHLMQHDVRRRGLSFPAYIWAVEGMIDLTILKDQWQDLWKKLKASQAASQAASAAIETDEHASLSPAFVERSQEAQENLVKIIFGILQYLHNISPTDATAEGVADSIWQSIRASDVVETCFPGQTIPLPDNVGPDLFSHSAVELYPWYTLQLDHSPDGKSYNQLWFIERIMADGALWVGRYTPVVQPAYDGELRRIMQSEVGKKALESEEVCKALISQEFREALKSEDINILLQSEEAREALESEEARELLRSEEVRGAFQSEDVCKLLQYEQLRECLLAQGALKARRSDENAVATHREQGEPNPGNMRRLESLEDGDRGSSRDLAPRGQSADNKNPFDTIMGRQFLHELTATFANAMSLDIDENGETDWTSWDPTMTRNHMIWFIHILNDRPWEPEAEGFRTRKLVSVFDVDGPCTVATPFEFDWEVLPRSEIRSLSVCWVVEHLTENIPKGENAANGKKKSADVCDARIGSKVVRGNRGTNLYKVVDKVRGLWEIMGLPEKAHYFI